MRAAERKPDAEPLFKRRTSGCLSNHGVPQASARRGTRELNLSKKGKMTLFPFFPYEHTDGGECAARFINGVPCNARRRGEKPPPARRAKWRDERIGRFPPASRKILLSAQKNFRESLLLLYHFPAPLGKPFAADFSLLFKGGRACSRKGGRARPNAKGGGLRPCGAEKEGKGRTPHGQGTATAAPRHEQGQ